MEVKGLKRRQKKTKLRAAIEWADRIDKGKVSYMPLSDILLVESRLVYRKSLKWRHKVNMRPMQRIHSQFWIKQQLFLKKTLLLHELKTRPTLASGLKKLMGPWEEKNFFLEGPCSIH